MEGFFHNFLPLHIFIFLLIDSDSALAKSISEILPYSMYPREIQSAKTVNVTKMMGFKNEIFDWILNFKQI